MTIELLFVDDEEMSRFMFSQMFVTKGYNVDVASSGLEAIEMSKKKDYNLVLMDYHMPGLNGIDASKIIKKDKSYVPIVLFSAAKRSELDINDVISQGLDGYMHKSMAKFDTICTEMLKYVH